MSELHEALLEVQKEIKPVKKTVNNHFFKSKYADLESVVEAVMPVLSKNGIASEQTTYVENGITILRTKLVYAKTGEEIHSDMPLICKDPNDPQKVIASLTYMRRASLTTICGLATQDDDGNTASGKEEPKTGLKVPAPLKKLTEDKIDNTKLVTFVSSSFDSQAGVYIMKTVRGDVYYTEKEVLAKIVRNSFGKALKISMTVNNEMQNILLEVLA